MEQGVRIPESDQTFAPKRFGANAPRVEVRRIDLTTARTSKRIFAGASTFLWAVDASSPSALLDVHFGDQAGAAVPVRQGMTIKGLPFSELYVTNSAQDAGSYITLVIVREQHSADLLDFEIVNSMLQSDLPKISGATSGRAFLFGRSVSAVAAQYTGFEIVTGSSGDLASAAISKVTIAPTAATYLQLRVGGLAAFAGAITPANKNPIAGLAASCVCTDGQAIAPLGSLKGLYYLEANKSHTFEFDPPLLIPGGTTSNRTAFILQTVNLGMSYVCEFFAYPG